MLELFAGDVAETRALGRALAELATPGTVLALVGGLGAGKTCFVQGIGLGAGVEDDVVSPTFILIAEHAGRLPLLHADLYRVAPEELPGLGLEEALERWPGIAAVEWADRGWDCLPEDHLRLELTEWGAGRRLRATATGPRHAALLARWVEARDRQDRQDEESGRHG